MLRQTTLVLLGLAVVLATAAAASATTYTLTDLGVLPGTGTTSYAMGVNDSGVVAGEWTTTTAGTSIVAAVYTGGDGGQYRQRHWHHQERRQRHHRQRAGELLQGLQVNSYIYNTNTSQYTNIGTQPGVCNGLVNHCGTDTFPYDTGSYELAPP